MVYANEFDDFLKENMNFIIDDYGFKLQKRENAVSFNNEIAVYELDDLRVIITREKGVYNFEFANKKDKDKYNQYDLGLIRNYFEHGEKYKEKDTSSDDVFDQKKQIIKAEGSVMYLRKNMHRIIALFGNRQFPETKMKLKALKKERAKILFN
jgi:hypothetical protein